MKTKNYFLLIFAFISLPIFAQSYQLSGTITDSDNLPLPGVSVSDKSSTTGVTSDFDGNYTLEVDNGDVLEFTFVGFKTKQITMDGRTTINVQLASGVALDEVVVVGSRNPNRTAVDTAVPVDVIDIKEITSVGAQVSLNEILNYVAPSFTSQAQTVSDGTDHIDPASLRGLGPDQVLVLINGKRRHTSSLINVNGTVGAGSVGTDLNAIPTASIKRVEVLRDGASAQYGSDAIAGVINIVLENKTGVLNMAVTAGGNMSSGSNHQEGGLDGEKIQLNANYGIAIGDKGGYLNLTGEFASRNPALRNATNLEQIYDIANAVEHAYVTANGGSVADMDTADYQSGAALLGTDYISATDQAAIQALDPNDPNFQSDLSALLPNGSFGNFASYQDLDDAQFAARGQERNDFRFKVGTSDLKEGKFFANFALPLSESLELYSFAGLSYRKGLGYGFLREPWRPKANVAVNPNGFLPGIQSDIVDQSIAIGIKKETTGGWFMDLSNTWGANSFGWTVVESTNASLGKKSPSDFDAGSFRFAQNTTNLDIHKFYEDMMSGFSLAFGAEYRIDKFTVDKGEERSYLTYDINGIPTVGGIGGATNALGESLPGTSQVFGGFAPRNEVDESRSNISLYVDVEADITDRLLISLATRYENYSDFGSTFIYKIASRFKVTDNFNLRAAYNTGFRAPSLHQQYFNRTSTVFNSEGKAEEVGLFRNDSKAAQLIGIDELKEETSNNISFGLTTKFGGFSLTVDAYQINIDDRIVLSGKFGAGGNPILEDIFALAGASKVQFLANAIDTESKGIDIVASYDFDISANYRLANSLSATFSETKVTNINVPEKIVDAGLSIDFFDGQEEAFLTIAQPRQKVNLTNILSNDKWTFLLRNVYFGEVTDPDEFKGQARVDGATVNSNAVYSAKIVTDLSVARKITKSFSAAVGANNIFDVYPDENRPGSQSNASFPYSRRTSQFGFMGRYVFARLTFTLD